MFVTVSAHVRHECSVLIREKAGLALRLASLNRAIRMLHAACEEMSTDHDAEGFDDIYTPLFDALSYLTEALHSVTTRITGQALIEKIRVYAEYALDSLDEAVTAEIPW